MVPLEKTLFAAAGLPSWFSPAALAVFGCLVRLWFM